MKFEKIEGHTRAMGEHQPEYETLYIRDDVQDYPFGGDVGTVPVNFMRFKVTPSREDIERLIAGESLYVSIMGHKFQPFSMQVGDPMPPGGVVVEIGEPEGNA